MRTAREHKHKQMTTSSHLTLIWESTSQGRVIDPASLFYSYSQYIKQDDRFFRPFDQDTGSTRAKSSLLPARTCKLMRMTGSKKYSPGQKAQTRVGLDLWSEKNPIAPFYHWIPETRNLRRFLVQWEFSLIKFFWCSFKYSRCGKLMV